MSFLGGDTTAMSEHSALLRTEATRLGTLLDGTGTAVRSVDWVGPDAEALRNRCEIVLCRGRELGSQLERLAREMAEHAVEQDLASEGDAGRPGAAIGGLLGRFGGLLGGGAGAGIGLGVGAGGGLLGGDQLGGGGLLTNALGAATPSHDGGSPTGTEHDSLDGELTDPDENWSHTDSTTVAGGGDSATASTTENGDGSTTESVTLSAQQGKVDIGDGTGRMTLDSEVAVTRDPEAGTVSYTFGVAETATVGAETPGPGEKDGAPVGVGAEASAELAGSYTVTLPEGSTIDDALAVDPTDPVSLPKGASMAIEDSLTTSFTASGSVTAQGIQAGASTTQTNSQGTVTSYSHHEDGTYEMSQGEKDSSGSATGVSIGIPKVAKLEAGTSAGTETATVEHTVFADSAEGTEALRQAHATGTPPTDTSGAVLERYTDVHRASTNGTFVEGRIGDDDLSVSQKQSAESISYESVQRTHSDGHQQSLERMYQEGPTSYVERRTETGEETVYVTGTDEAAPRHGAGADPTQRDTFGEMYSLDLDSPALEPQDTRIVYTDQEVARMRAHEDGTSPSGSEIEYLWNRSSEDPTRAAEQMYRDYNGIDSGDPIPQGLGQSDPGVPGRTLTPHQTVESAR